MNVCSYVKKIMVRIAISFCAAGRSFQRHGQNLFALQTKLRALGRAQAEPRRFERMQTKLASKDRILWGKASRPRMRKSYTCENVSEELGDRSMAVQNPIL